MRRAAVGAVALLVGLAGMRAQGAIPEVISFQGRLADAAGDPVTVATDVVFKLYDGGGGEVWSETHAGVTPDEDGLFSVMLGATSTFATAGVDFTVPLWLGVTVGTDAEMIPRFELGTVPYAMNADRLDGLDSTDLAAGEHTHDGTDITSTVAQATNADTLDALDSTAFAGAGHAHFGETWTGSATYGLKVRNTSTAPGATYGVHGQSDSSGNYSCGVLGRASAATGVTYGVRGVNGSSSGRGVAGRVNAATGLTYGVYGESDSTSGVGVFGHATATTGTTYGVYGKSDSTASFDFYASGLGADYGSESSIRWKSAVTTIGNALDKVVKMRGVYFNWDKDHGGQHDMGMIAEEVGGVLPEIVQYEENGKDAIGMDYSKLTPVLVEAVKELKFENDTLRAELAELKATVEALAGAGE